LNLSKICLAKKKTQYQKGSATTRTTADHIEIAESITKRFERKTHEDDPFLRAKLKHIIKKWPNQHVEE